MQHQQCLLSLLSLHSPIVCDDKCFICLLFPSLKILSEKGITRLYFILSTDPQNRKPSLLLLSQIRNSAKLVEIIHSPQTIGLLQKLKPWLRYFLLGNGTHALRYGQLFLALKKISTTYFGTCIKDF